MWSFPKQNCCSFCVPNEISLEGFPSGDDPGCCSLGRYAVRCAPGCAWGRCALRGDPGGFPWYPGIGHKLIFLNRSCPGFEPGPFRLKSAIVTVTPRRHKLVTAVEVAGWYWYFLLPGSLLVGFPSDGDPNCCCSLGRYAVRCAPGCAWGRCALRGDGGFPWYPGVGHKLKKDRDPDLNRGLLV
jgi:hypothetical protein